MPATAARTVDDAAIDRACSPSPAVRPLTPMQLATSLRLAAADPVSLTAGKPEEVDEAPGAAGE